MTNLSQVLSSADQRIFNDVTRLFCNLSMSEYGYGATTPVDGTFNFDIAFFAQYDLTVNVADREAAILDVLSHNTDYPPALISLAQSHGISTFDRSSLVGVTSSGVGNKPTAAPIVSVAPTFVVAGTYAELTATSYVCFHVLTAY
jgi:hypothetical protein